MEILFDFLKGTLLECWVLHSHYTQQEITVSDFTVRADLADVEETVRHLCELSQYFSDQRSEVRRFWKLEISSRVWRIKSSDFDFVRAIERIYESADPLANDLAGKLSLINDTHTWPMVTDYIADIRSCQKWIDGDNEVIAKAEAMLASKPGYDLDYDSIRHMIDLHKKMLKVLRGVDADLEALENCKYLRRTSVKSKLTLPYEHSADFTMITFPNSEPIEFSERQGEIMLCLYNNALNGNHYMLKKVIMKELGTPTSKWADAFRTKSDVYSALIEEHSDQKRVRLKLPNLQ